jgi:hypothetical protein
VAVPVCCGGGTDRVDEFDGRGLRVRVGSGDSVVGSVVGVVVVGAVVAGVVVAG